MRQNSWTPFLVLYWREIRRFMSVAVQTVFSPLVSSSLYLLIFGVSLGQSISLQNGVNYMVFLIPGILTMSSLNNAFQNTSSSIVVGKFSGELEDLRIAPLTVNAILWAMALGGLTRGFIVGLVTLLVGEVFHFVTLGNFLEIFHPFLLMIFLTLGSLTFAFLGITVAFWAKTFDQLSAVSAFILLPLIYLGGVFFSLESLHPFWQTLSQFNPLLYFINGVRYAILGVSDVEPRMSFMVSALSLFIFYFVSYRVLRGNAYQRW